MKDRRIDRCDALVRKIVLVRDKRCRNCGSVRGLTAAHIVGRGNMATRCNLDNVVALCWDPCHQHFDTHPAAWEAWCENEFGLSFDLLKQQALAGTATDRVRVDWDATLTELKKTYNQMET